MRRILIIGSGGAGKSHAAIEMARKLGLELIHLDRHFWKPNWVETPKAEWRQIVSTLVNKDSWIIDGNYAGTFDIRFPAADTIVFLDFPPLLCGKGDIHQRSICRPGPDRGRPTGKDGCRKRENYKEKRNRFTIKILL